MRFFAALEGGAGLALQRACIHHFLFGEADGVHDDEVRLGLCIGRDRLEVVGRENARAAPLHLLKKGAAMDRAHEEHDFQLRSACRSLVLLFHTLSQQVKKG